MGNVDNQTNVFTALIQLEKKHNLFDLDTVSRLIIQQVFINENLNEKTTTKDLVKTADVCSFTVLNRIKHLVKINAIKVVWIEGCKTFRVGDSVHSFCSDLMKGFSL